MRYFLAVAEYRHFSRAAESLHVSTSAVSRAVKDLEQELETPLFVRGHHRLELTATGAVFVTRATAILSEFETMRADVAGLSRREPGVLRVGVPMHVPPTLVSAVVEAVAARRDGDVVVEFKPLRATLTDLRAGRVDLAVCYLPIEHDDLMTTLIARYPYQVALRADDPLATHDSLCMADLASRLVATPCDSIRAYGSQDQHGTLDASAVKRFSTLPWPDPFVRDLHVRRTGEVSLILPPPTGGHPMLFEDTAFAVLALRDGPMADLGLVRRVLPAVQSVEVESEVTLIRDAVLQARPPCSVLPSTRS
ncbi:LysR family transcriptional regulator [Streptomyces sp. JV176]|nr:LysR family transcriptional regulator [Streptomyces sp. JV176]